MCLIIIVVVTALQIQDTFLSHGGASTGSVTGLHEGESHVDLTKLGFVMAISMPEEDRGDVLARQVR